MPRKLASCLLALSLTLPNITPANAGADLNSLSALAAEATHLKLKPAEWQSLADKQIVTHAVSTRQTQEMAGFGAMVAEASPQEFITAFKTLSVFERSETTIACGRFSAEPMIEDLAKLTVSDKDLYALMKAQVNAAEIKLSEPDIARIRAAAGPSPLFNTKLKTRLAAEYKQMLLDKARAYLERGEASLTAYADQEETVNAKEAFAGILRSHSSAAERNPKLYAALNAFPNHEANTTESFLYWALQKFGKLKPVISLAHVMIYREGQRVFIASKQIYSSHYTEAGLGVAELIPFSDQSGRTRTLAAYTVRLQVDLLGGSMGFMKKRMAQPHMLETIKTSLHWLRLNVEALRQRSNYAV